MRGAFASRGAAGALHSPAMRAGLTAAVATAAFGPRAHALWWQHANGGYGWVGPMYWPFAYTDMYDYALWGPPYAAPFWTYGYNDIYTGIFGPYGYDTMTAIFHAMLRLTRRVVAAHRAVPSRPIRWRRCATPTPATLPAFRSTRSRR